MPGQHTEATATRLAATGMRCTAHKGAQEGDIQALVKAVDLTHLGSIADPWASTGPNSVQMALRRILKARVTTNGPDKEQTQHLLPLQPHTYDSMGASDAIITCPQAEWADVTLPLAMLYARMVVCMLVPVTYTHTMSQPRRKFMNMLLQTGRLVMLQSRNHVAHSMWILAFVDSVTKNRMMISRSQS